jgi:hypothetical protein
MLYSVNKSAMRRAIDIAKKSLGPKDETPSGFRLSPERGHAAPAPALAIQRPPPLPA